MITINLFKKILPYLFKIKQKLNITENEFFEEEFEDTNKAFSFWIYSIVDDLYKVGMKVIKEKEIIESKKNDYIYKSEDDLKGLNFERYLYENISIELDLWIRKLVEHLLNLILLNNLKKEDLEVVSKIYFLSIKIKNLLSNYNNYKTYYDFEHDYFLIEKKFLIDKNNILIKENGKPYFLKNLNFSSPGNIFKNFAELYKESLKFGTDNQKLILGLTYYMYHNLSQGIHGNGHFRDKNIKLESCIKKYNHLLLLMLNIIYIIYELLDIEKDDLLEKGVLLDNILKTNFEQKYNKGDLVNFNGDLFRIIDVKKSNYGYFSYLIFDELSIGENKKWIPQELLIIT